MFVTCFRKCQQVRKHPENIQNYVTESYCNYLEYKIKIILTFVKYYTKNVGLFYPNVGSNID